MDTPEAERKEITATDARDRLTELVDRARFGGERFVITRNGKPVAAIVGPADLDTLEAAAA